MQLQQNNYAIALSAQAEILNELSNKLDEWSGLIVAGKNDSLAEMICSPRLKEVLNCASTSRTALKMLEKPAQIDDSTRSALGEFSAAHDRIMLSTNRLRALIQRGLLFTTTMLNGISALAASENHSASYDGHGRAAMLAGNGMREEA